MDGFLLDGRRLKVWACALGLLGARPAFLACCDLLRMARFPLGWRHGQAALEACLAAMSAHCLTFGACHALPAAQVEWATKKDFNLFGWKWTESSPSPSRGRSR